MASTKRTPQRFNVTRLNEARHAIALNADRHKWQYVSGSVAHPKDIPGWVARVGFTLISRGILVGIALAASLTRVTSAALFGVKPIPRHADTSGS